MSNNIPFEIQVEILELLPAKSLIRFRSVSKAWRFLIDSSEFIDSHAIRHSQPHHLLLKYIIPGNEYAYVSIADDDAFPQEKFDLTVPMALDDNTFPQQNFDLTVPGSVKILRDETVVGTSHGLFCFFGYFSGSNGLTMGFAVLWNPSIRKSILINLHYFNKGAEVMVSEQMVLGFGVCPVNMEPKIVMIRRFSFLWDEVTTNWEIKIYNLNSGKWRNLSSNLPRNNISVMWSQAVIDRFIYWLAFDMPVIDDEYQHLLLSFDMIDEVFRVVDLPVSIQQMKLSISKLRESLILLEHNDLFGNCGVWMMGHDDGGQTLFTKLFTIETPFASIRPHGFRENGEVLMEAEDDYRQPFGFWSAVVSYDPNLKQINDLRIRSTSESLCVNSYVETLLLLNQPGCVSY